MNETSIKTIKKRNDILKLIAILTMLIDHVGATFFPNIITFRIIGRIAFPIFAYQLTLGYKYTSNLKSYFKRIFIFACISYLPYAVFLGHFVGDVFHPNFIAFNVMFLLDYAIIMLIIFDKTKLIISNYLITKSNNLMIKSIIYSLVLIFIIILPEILTITIPHFMFSYSTYGLLMILFFYIFDNNFTMLIHSFLFISCINFLSLYINSSDMNYVIYKVCLQSFCIMAYFIIRYFKNIQFEFKLNKYFAYYFYPVHICILIAIKYFIDYL